MHINYINAQVFVFFQYLYSVQLNLILIFGKQKEPNAKGRAKYT